MTCIDVRESAAVALLGGSPLPPEVDRHLDTCAACREEVTTLSSTVGLLGLAGPGVLPEPEAPDPALLGRLLAEASRRRHDRRRTALLVAVVAACFAVLVAITGGVVLHDDGRQPASVVAVGAARDASTGVAGTTRVTANDAGSQVAFTAVGVEPGTVCTVRVVTRDGAAHPVVTWTADYQAEGQVTGTTSIPASSITRVELVDGDGHLLVPVPLLPA